VSKQAQEIIYRGKILTVARETHQMPNLRKAEFEIIQHPGGAAALPVLADGRLILIRQFRPAVEDFVWEIPAGRLEAGETGTACIERELIEEIGYRTAAVEPLGFIYSSIGFCNEKIHLYIAGKLEKTATALEPDEFIEPQITSLPQALKMLETGQIVDAKTQIVLLRYAMRQGVLK
jgi:ADP-ribose pyrophosphatase